MSPAKGVRVAWRWLLALAMTLLCMAYQDKTGPTYPLEGTLQTARGPLSFRFPRSQIVGRDLPLALLEPVPEGIAGTVTYRRLKSYDEWTTVPLHRGTFQFTHRGRHLSVEGLGALLPGLQERAGKYEFFVHVDDGTGPRSVSGSRPIVARFRGDVPAPVLALHIMTIFLSMALAVRTSVEALAGGETYGLSIATAVSLLAGGFLLGPLVQWYAFGVWWSGLPFGIDWTDNKVLVELVLWGAAIWRNRPGRRDRGAVYLAGVLTLVVYFIPHSVFGSEFDYRTGTGRGTAG